MSKRGFAPIIVVLAISLLALVPILNINSTTKFSGPAVKGELIAKGGDDDNKSSGGSGDSGGSHDSGGSSGGSSGSSNSSSGSSSGGSGGSSGSTTISTQKVEKPEKKEKPEKVEFKIKLKEPEVENEVEDEIENEIERAEVERVEIRSSASGELEIETKISTATAARKGKKATASGELTLGTSEIKIKAQGNEIEFKFKGIGALTNFPLSFDKTTNTLIVNTPNGPRPIRILPDQASEVAETSGVENLIERIELAQTATGSAEPVAFKVKGKRVGSLLGIFPVTADVETEVGAETGQILTTTEPLWLRLLRPLIQ